jgi:hypothetical protein
MDELDKRIDEVKMEIADTHPSSITQMNGLIRKLRVLQSIRDK